MTRQWRCSFAITLTVITSIRLRPAVDTTLAGHDYCQAMTTLLHRGRTVEDGFTFLEGKISAQMLLAFVFGVIFLSVMLGFSVFIKNPSPFQTQVFTTVLALAAAGAGAMIPGTAGYDGNGWMATGGLAIGAVVWFSRPALARAASSFEEPKESPLMLAEAFLKDLDTGDLSAAWLKLGPVGRSAVRENQSDFATLFANSRKQLGCPVERKLVSSGAPQAQPNVAPGLYRQAGFRTVFSPDQGRTLDPRLESVLLRANSNIQWEIADYNFSPLTIK